MNASNNFDQFSVLSDNSAPRTPSPADLLFANHVGAQHPPTVANSVGPGGIKHSHIGHSHRHPPRVFGTELVDDQPLPPQHSLLQELYDPDSLDLVYPPALPEHHPRSHPVQYSHPHPHPLRRATFPCARQDREDSYNYIPQQHIQTYRVQDNYYPEPVQDNYVHHHQHHHPHPSSYRDFDDSQAVVKLEDHPPSILSQPAFYPPQLAPATTQASSTYHHSPNPHTHLTVQHTDDAASKETQYLRRRCFNCHTTEPPSWRRSTLNPGKIVCNKCGLYERTHLRPRPLRFDELRAGCKARKAAGMAALTPPKGSSLSPKSRTTQVKKEPKDDHIVRRSPVSSVSSRTGSGSGSGSSSGSAAVSDWDDSVSVYSSGSTFGSPASPGNSHPGNASCSSSSARHSESPPHTLLHEPGTTGIRLPDVPLLPYTDPQPVSPCSSTSYYTPPPAGASFFCGDGQGHEQVGVAGLETDSILHSQPQHMSMLDHHQSSLSMPSNVALPVPISVS